MSQWSHLICERCWYDGDPQKKAFPKDPPGVTEEGYYKQASRVVDPDTGESDPGACCFCGLFTLFGAYLRFDPKVPQCKGDHDHPEEWSLVGPVSPPT